MKKALWMKIIVFVTIFMISYFEILPTAPSCQTSVVYAAYDRNDEQNKNANILEMLVSRLFLCVGVGVYALISICAGESFTIEDILFNDYTNTSLDFFRTNNTNIIRENEFIKNAHLKDIVDKVYGFLQSFTILAYLMILVYMAIRILLSSTAEKGAKYKELAVYWVEGIIILFIFPYVMKYAIYFNNAFVAFMKVNRSIELSFPEVPTSTRWF